MLSPYHLKVSATARRSWRDRFPDTAIADEHQVGSLVEEVQIEQAQDAGPGEQGFTLFGKPATSSSRNPDPS
jgi:hypothetical protein